MSPLAGKAPEMTIDDVIAKLIGLGERFEAEHGPKDGVLSFNQLYLSVTESVRQAAEKPGFFEDPAAIERLDVLFAGLYFDAVDAMDQDEPVTTAAWRLLFEHRDRPGVIALQFAVAGMNAHINHDLPFALIEQWQSSGGRPHHGSPAHNDFTKVNDILRQVEVTMAPKLIPPGLENLDHGRFDHLQNRIGMWVVEDARAQAWETASHLWAVRYVRLAHKAWIGAVDLMVTNFGRMLLEPM